MKKSVKIEHLGQEVRICIAGVFGDYEVNFVVDSSSFEQTTLQVNDLGTFVTDHDTAGMPIRRFDAQIFSQSDSNRGETG
jgi:hypothetical protein